MTTLICDRVAAIAVLLAGVATAQDTVLVELRRSAHLPVLLVEGGTAISIDADGDGDLDMVTGSIQGCRLLANDGAGHFELAVPSALPAPAGNAVALAPGDVDGDGDVDLIVGYSDRRDRLLRAEGGRFVDAGDLPAHPGSTSVLVLCDVEADGDLDLFVGTGTFQDRLLLNDGTGTFTDATDRLPPRDSSTWAVVAMDIDRDGATDLVLGEDQLVRMLRNDSTGRFAIATFPTPPPAFGAIALATGDVDGNGYGDLLLGTRLGVDVRLWLGDGVGFVDGSARLPTRTNYLNWSVALADLDGDGDLDALAGDGTVIGYEPDHVKLWLNDGSGGFTDVTSARFPSEDGETRAILVADVDRDLDVDVVLIHSELYGAAPELLMNGGNAWFVSTTRVAVPVAHENTTSLAAGDVDDDGDLDLVRGANRNFLDPLSGADVLLRFDAATGVYVEDPAAIPRAFTLTQRSRFADLDGDGDLDIVAARNGQPAAVLINDGSGTFADETAARLPGAPNASNDVAIGDVDGDGDPDLVFGEGSLLAMPDRLFRNDGSGAFVEAAGAVPGGGGTTGVVLVDVDGDLDLDIVRSQLQFFTPTPRGASLLRNDGTGQFVEDPAGVWVSSAGAGTCIVSGDVDRDGDPDVLLGRSSDVLLLVNDGAGRLVEAVGACLPVAGGVSFAALGDLDGDGFHDVVCGDRNRTAVWIGDGRGCFVDVTPRWLPANTSGVSRVELSDIDDDGDLDVVLARGCQPHGCADRVLINRTRSIALPWLPMPGRSFVIEVAAEPGWARYFRVAIPLLAPERVHLPLPPFGVFGLRPDALMQLEPVYVPPRSGTARVLFGVPNDTGLVGTSWHAQAVLMDPLRTRLTNVATTVVAR